VGLASLVALAIAGCGGDDPDGDGPGGGEYAAPSVPCVGRPAVPATVPPPTGTSTTALGPQTAPYELQAPAARPRGVAVLLHGGGWVEVGPGQVQVMRPTADAWLARGWATANLDYRPCGAGLDDVLVMHDAIRRLVGPDTPIVVVGESAGAHLGLLLAANRPDSIGAVIAKAPPTDPHALADQQAFDPVTGAPSNVLPRALAGTWRAAFGERLDESSPVARADDIDARLVVAWGEGDVIIPEGQIDGLEKALEDARPDGWQRVLRLGRGSERFPHTSISAESAARLRLAVDEAIEPWTDGDPRAPAAVPGWWSFPGR